MTESDLRNEPWFKNAPEWMGEVVVRITEARDDARKLLAKLNESDQLRAEREHAFELAVLDMKEFANRMFGPESELSKLTAQIASLNTKLDDMSRQSGSRDDALDRRLTKIEQRVDELERERKAS